MRFSLRTGGVKMNMEAEKENIDNVKNDDIMKLSPVVYNTGINQSLYTELSMDDLFDESQLSMTPLKNYDNDNEKIALTPSQEEILKTTQPQVLIFERKEEEVLKTTQPQVLIFERKETTLASNPETKKKLKKLDESSLRKFYYLLYKQKSRAKEYDEVMKMVANFSEFNFNYETMKAKVLIDANIWGRPKLVELCNLLSLEENGSRSELTNRIFSFLGNLNSTGNGKPKIVEEITGSKKQKQKQTSSSQVILNKKLGDSESIQARLNRLPVNKMLKSLCFIMTNVKHHQPSTIKDSISNFCGFKTDDLDGHLDALKERMLLNAGQWSLISLQQACDLFGISQEGTRATLVARFIDFFRVHFSNQTSKIRTSSSGSNKIEDTDGLSDNNEKKRKRIQNISADSDDVKKIASRRKIISSSSEAAEAEAKASTASENWVITITDGVPSSPIRSSQVKANNMDLDQDDDEECDYDNLGYMSTGTLEE